MTDQRLFKQLGEFAAAKSSTSTELSLGDCIREINAIVIGARQKLLPALETLAASHDRELHALAHRYRSVVVDFVSAATAVELPAKYR